MDMTDNRLHEIQRCWHQVDAELESIRDGKVTIGSDPAAREGELLQELEVSFQAPRRHARQLQGTAEKRLWPVLITLF